MPGRGHFDAVGSIEMGEHVGERNYPTYAEVLRRSVPRRPGAGAADVAHRQGPGGGPFIESFIAPDMYMRPSARPSRTSSAGGSRCATCTRCASTTC